MSLKVKNTSSKKQKKLSEFSLKEKKEDEKENKYLHLKLKKKKNIEEPVESQCEEKHNLHESTPLKLKPAVKEKTLGFWCKKLQDLKDSSEKNKKSGLYDFNVSDESDFFNEKKKKPKKKKKRQPAVSICRKPKEKMARIHKFEKKVKEIHSQSLCREKIILRRERQKLAEKGEGFTFSTEIPSLGISSTPAVNKDNLVGASNFLFLSPIIKENATQQCGSVNKSLPLGEKITNNDQLINISQDTPKVKTRLKRISNQRVLRSGKVLSA